MKTKVLLVDPSLTVQKVVSLTLDKQEFEIQFAANRSEMMQRVSEARPDTLLVSDGINDIDVNTLPTEIESLMGGQSSFPIVLVTNREIDSLRNYAAVLRKPFTPVQLRELVRKFEPAEAHRHPQPSDEGMVQEPEDRRMERMFNETFNDEPSLARETLESTNADKPLAELGQHADSLWESKSSMKSDTNEMIPMQEGDTEGVFPDVSEAPLWGGEMEEIESVRPVPGPKKANHSLEQQMMDRIQAENLDEIVDKVLNRIVPPIVERLVQKRLDELLKESDGYGDVGR